MNRRRFLELMGMAAVGGTVVYSFPSIIVPKNIVTVPEFNYRNLGYDLSAYARPMRGLPFIVNSSSKSFQGVWT